MLMLRLQNIAHMKEKFQVRAKLTIEPPVRPPDLFVYLGRSGFKSQAQPAPLLRGSISDGYAMRAHWHNGQAKQAGRVSEFQFQCE